MDTTCVGFQSTEPVATTGLGGKCTLVKQSATKWGTAANGACTTLVNSVATAVADDTGLSPTYPTTNVHASYTGLTNGKDLAACKAACLLAGATNCKAIQH